MPRKVKNNTKVKKTKLSNKNKIVVNVQVNSHNKKHNTHKPKSLAEQAHIPKGSTSSVANHYFTLPHSNHSEVSNLYKELLKDRDNQLTKVKDEMKIFKDELERVKNASAKPEEDDNSSVGSFPSIQNETVADYNNSEPIIEKGGGKTPYKTPAKNRGIMSLFKVKPEEKEEEAQPELGGRAHSEPAQPTGNALAVSVGKEERATPLKQAGTTEKELRLELLKLDKATLRGLYRTIVGTDAPSAMKETKIVQKLLADYRQQTAQNLSAIKDITNK